VAAVAYVCAPQALGWGLESRAKGVSKIGSCSVCRVCELILSRPERRRRSDALPIHGCVGWGGGLQLMAWFVGRADWSNAPPLGTVSPAALTHGNPRSLKGARLCVVAHVDDLRPEHSFFHGVGILIQGLAAEYAEVVVLVVAGEGDDAVDPALLLTHLTTPAAEESAVRPKPQPVYERSLRTSDPFSSRSLALVDSSPHPGGHGQSQAARRETTPQTLG
jgi:hypothetical protein